MSKAVSKTSSNLEELSSILLSTLDESIFFTELSNYLKKKINAEKVSAYRVKKDNLTELVCKNGRPHYSKGKESKIEGIVGHVIRTNSTYFCNDRTRDPLCANDTKKNVVREMALPIAHEGVIVGVVLFYESSEKKEYSREDIITLQTIINEIKIPLANMKMYLSAKSLNESLMRQLEQKEIELSERSEKKEEASHFLVEDPTILGKSKVMEDCLSLIDKAANNDFHVLFTGEKGVGKKVGARRIHARSKRSKQPFLILDCSLMKEDELEREIFGEEIYNFKSGREVREGLLERASKGTILITNVHLLPKLLQAKLNHFLTESVASRVGSRTSYKSKARIIASTTMSKSDLIEQDSFREDFLNSLSTMMIDVPALRNREDDIELLACHFLNNGKGQDQQKIFSPGALNKMRSHVWRGNIRELRTMIERSYIISDGTIVEKSHIEINEVGNKKEADNTAGSNSAGLNAAAQLGGDFSKLTLEEVEKHHITLTLDHLGGNKTRTAKSLGITVKTLYNKLHNYGLIQAKEA